MFVDSPTGATGFAQVGRNIGLQTKDSIEWHMIGPHYYGDPHNLPFKIYPPYFGNMPDNPYGYERIHTLLAGVKPDFVLIINDPWVAGPMITKIREKYHGPVYLYTPVDSENIQPRFINPLNLFTKVIAYTEFGKAELIQGGLGVPCTVIPHGVNTDMYYPVDRKDAIEYLGFAEDLNNYFIVQFVGANQPRKRVGLFAYVINEWLKKYPHEDVLWYYHGALKQSDGVNIVQIAEYLTARNKQLDIDLNLLDRFVTTDDTLTPLHGIPEQAMKYVYGMADLFLSPCAQEGWGLCIHESMACGVPAILPEYSALAEWPNSGCFYVPVDDTPDFQGNQLNTVHKYPNIYWTIEALENLYTSTALRLELGKRALKVATDTKFNWKNISNQFLEIFMEGIQDGKADASSSGTSG